MLKLTPSIGQRKKVSSYFSELIRALEEHACTQGEAEEKMRKHVKHNSPNRVSTINKR